ncbi:hypothetical protein PRUPE_2G267000 [Prunus persica]|uniref:Uncharacterized protein n=1 Tax=Prunus persica TaxID=3760 RepID=A0A251QQB5_PRUPE|nr:hypothetical protein PRUPE_2G267000 [Prunus persica]
MHCGPIFLFLRRTYELHWLIDAARQKFKFILLYGSFSVFSFFCFFGMNGKVCSCGYKALVWFHLNKRIRGIISEHEVSQVG